MHDGSEGRGRGATRHEGDTPPVRATSGRVAAQSYSDPVLARCAVVEIDGFVMRRIGPVAIRRRLGAGGMGVVFAGTHLRLETDVAVKVLAGQHGRVRSKVADRFRREARYAARLRSPNLVGVLDVDDDPESQLPFMVMELVVGLAAEEWRTQHAAGRADEAQALDLCIAATTGLAAAHAEGVVHRDVKPSNVLVPRRGDGTFDLAGAKLADLGLAFLESSPAEFTTSGILLGSPGYMPPEQIEDPRNARKPADVFAMGATLYALLVGRPPFHAASNGERIVRTLTGGHERASVARPGVSPLIEVVVERCLDRDPARRFADASALLEALRFVRDRLGAPRAGGASADAPEIEKLADLSEIGLPAVTPSLWTLDGSPTPEVGDEPDEIPTITVLMEDRGRRKSPPPPARREVRAPASAPDDVAPAAPAAPAPERRTSASAVIAAVIFASLVGCAAAVLLR